MKTPPRPTTRIWLATALAAALAALPLACSKEAEPASPTPPEQAAPIEPAPAEPASPESPDPASNPASNPDPSSPAPAQPSTPEECRAAGGTFVPSIGDTPKCPAGTTLLGPIRHGIEGGLCCK